MKNFKCVLFSTIMCLIYNISTFSQEERELNKIIQDEIEACEGHFDIVPYLLIGTSAYLDADLATAVEQGTISQSQLRELSTSWETYLKTGNLLSKEKRSDVEAVKCAMFAKGFLLGGMHTKNVTYSSRIF